MCVPVAPSCLFPPCCLFLIFKLHSTRRNDRRRCIVPSLLTLSHAGHRLITHLTKATTKVGISRHSAHLVPRFVSCPQTRVVPNKAAEHQQPTAQPGSCPSARATCTAQACLEADSRVIAFHCTVLLIARFLWAGLSRYPFRASSLFFVSRSLIIFAVWAGRLLSYLISQFTVVRLRLHFSCFFARLRLRPRHVLTFPPSTRAVDLDPDVPSPACDRQLYRMGAGCSSRKARQRGTTARL